MKTTDILNTIWMLSIEEIDQLLLCTQKVRSLKVELAGVSTQSSEHSASLPKPPPARIPPTASQQREVLRLSASARTPLRAPKPGSLRHAVHEVLRGSKTPLRRAEIISTIAKTRGLEINETLKTKIGNIVNCTQDRQIRKVAHGVYRFDG